MKVHWFQHVPFEGLGRIENWIETKGFTAVCTGLWAGDPLPNPAEIEFLVVMGGPMSVNDEEGFAWLSDEKKVVRAVIDRGKPVLGVCLGAQMIASAMGARVYQGSAPEVGWMPVSRAEESDSAPFVFPNRLTVFQWHGETFDLPERAVRLAGSEVCYNQAFLLGERVVGVQFHLETTLESAAALVKNCPEDLASGGGYVQSAEEILALTEDCAERTAPELFCLLDFLLRSEVSGSL